MGKTWNAHLGDNVGAEKQLDWSTKEESMAWGDHAVSTRLPEEEDDLVELSYAWLG